MRNKIVLVVMLLILSLIALPVLSAKEQPAALVYDGKAEKDTEQSEEERWVRTEPAYHKFTLVKGKGVEVCEAYLKRLHKTWFEWLPFCDRPENTDVPGFEKLNRVVLTPEEIYTVYFNVGGFLSGSKNFYDAWAKRSGANATKKEDIINTFTQDIGNRQLGAYRYNPLVDFDNDGVFDNLLVWKINRCGSYEGVNQFPVRGATIVLALTSDSRAVDENKTKQLIGHPIGGYPEPGDKSFFEGFRPVGRCMGIFRYKSVTYFDTFFDEWGDFWGKRRESPNIYETLAVFKRERGQTKQVCEYLWEIPYETYDK